MRYFSLANVVFILVLLVSSFLTFYQFSLVPGGLNQDEVDAGYEAYALLSTGSDKWGYHLPPYFVSWGSGQNVLASYLDIPFISLFGLTDFSIRIVSAIMGVATIGIFFFVLKNIYNEKAALIGMILLALSPWHIMMVRWSLESNLLPFFLLLGVFLFQQAYTSLQRRYLLCASFASFALALYAYGIAIVIIPFLILLLCYSVRKEIKQNWKYILLSFILFFAISFPFFLFILDNDVLHYTPGIFLHLPFSVPLLPSNRLSQVSTGFTNTLGSNFHFIINCFSDGYIWNMIPGFPPLGYAVLPLAVCGIWAGAKKKTLFAHHLAYWVIASLPLFFVADLDINRANAVFLPLIGLSAITITVIYESIHKRIFKILVMSGFFLYLFMTGGLFILQYFQNFNAQAASAFNIGFHSALKVAERHATPHEPIYVTGSVSINYAYVLFYLHASPIDFRNHSYYFINKHGYYDVIHYDRYYFDTSSIPSQQYIYILKTGDEVPCTLYHTVYKKGIWRIGECR